jgi:tyrosine-protein kinase Etk/Wzc
MRETLERMHAPVAGMVLNDKTGKAGEHYSNGYYGYYGYYSDEACTPEENKTIWKRFVAKLPRFGRHAS